MKKYILYLFVFIAFMAMANNVVSSSPVLAQEEAGKSASLAAKTSVAVKTASPSITPTVTPPMSTQIYASMGPVKLTKKSDYAIKKLAIKRVLERYNSPVADTADGFIAACKESEINCYLLPSIMGIESGFGKQYIPGTFNGFGWGRGNIPFNSWEESYMVIGKGLRENYINRGATDIDSIGAIYCEGNTWSGKVKFFMAQFEAEEATIALNFDQIEVQ